MAGKAGLKAGMIGIVVLLLITLVDQFLPMTGILRWVSMGVSLIVYAGIGVLAGIFLAPPRTPGKGAGAGAIAGLLGGLVAGVVGIAIVIVQYAGGGDIRGLTPEQMRQIQQVRDMGVQPVMFGLMSSPGVVCVMAIGSGLAAIGGAIYAAVRPD